ncbi:MAG: hypothetical protein WCD70_08075 [Alphaproteobacteria bacterium]
MPVKSIQGSSRFTPRKLTHGLSCPSLALPAIGVDPYRRSLFGDDRKTGTSANRLQLALVTR